MMFVFGLPLSTQGAGYTAAETHTHGESRAHSATPKHTNRNIQKLRLLSQIPVTPSCQVRVDLIRPWSVFKTDWARRCVSGWIPLLWWGWEAVAVSHTQPPKPREMLRSWIGSHDATGMLESLHSSDAEKGVSGFTCQVMKTNSSLCERQRSRRYQEEEQIYVVHHLQTPGQLLYKVNVMVLCRDHGSTLWQRL